jgi:phosphatidylethanolamine-binding protein (PEBP) family uncharacterized protein
MWRVGRSSASSLFSVFAVKAERLEVNPDSSGAVVGFNLHFNMLAKAAIMGLYKR